MVKRRQDHARRALLIERACISELAQEALRKELEAELRTR
jgi:DNA-binding transcriptional regulator YdaS (Cro superfamily)